MIERIAREIARASALDEGKDWGTANDFTDAVWEDFVQAATAVLATMRDPTDAMIKAFVDHGEHGWQCMIDAALVAPRRTNGKYKDAGSRILPSVEETPFASFIPAPSSEAQTARASVPLPTHPEPSPL